jgi:hypothetical protein
MTRQDREGLRSRRYGEDGASRENVSYAQQQYLHLVRLAWVLREAGVGSIVDLSGGAEPAVVIVLASGRLKITAIRRGEGWAYAWGRGRNCRARADADAVARQIAGLVTR